MTWNLVFLLRSFLKRFTADRYRPERHYMRGPGPKARAVAAAAQQRS